MYEIEHIKQRTNDDCVLACTAMVAGVSYEEAEKAYDRPPPYCTSQCAVALVKLNCWLDLSTPCDLKPNNVYIVTVGSLNTMGSYHAIVVTHDIDGSLKVYDPCKGIEGKKYYNMYSDMKSGWLCAERIERINKE